LYGYLSFSTLKTRKAEKRRGKGTGLTAEVAEYAEGGGAEERRI